MGKNHYCDKKPRCSLKFREVIIKLEVGCVFNALRNKGRRGKVIKISQKRYNKYLWNTCHKRKGVTLLKMKMVDENIHLYDT